MNFLRYFYNIKIIYAHFPAFYMHLGIIFGL